MESLRNNLGLIDLNKFVKFGFLRMLSKYCTFMYNGEKYYFKKATDEQLYNELIAYELACDYGIPCVPYDIGIIAKRKGVFCKGLERDGYRLNHITRCISIEYDDSARYNNLEDLWYALSDIFKNDEIVKKLMDQLIDVFLFDVLIANYDRHSDNMMLETCDKDVSFTKIYDNTEMLTDWSIKNHRYALRVENSDYFGQTEEDLLFKFLDISDSSYLERLKSKLWIISEENIASVFKRVESKTQSTMSFYEKEQKMKLFQQNLESILKVIDEIEKKYQVLLSKKN